MPTATSTDRGGAGPTSYALLGLLSVKSWTTYELAQQVQRSLNWFWPRAERKLYDEPKRLVARGLATAEEEWTGKRKRTVYSITAAGRRALAEWIGEPSAPPAWENEAMVKVFFADAGSLADLRGALAAMADQARERLDRLAAYGEQEPVFPERLHLSLLTLRLQVEHEQATLRWVRWASDELGRWRSTSDPGDWDAEAAATALVKAARSAR